MNYQMLILDIDGTLRPQGQTRVPRENVQAVMAVQRAGVQVAIATGRGYAGVPRQMLRGIRPDYWLCASGAQILDKNGGLLHGNTMTNEEMYALVDFFEDHDLPLSFTFSDSGYAYLGYQVFYDRYMAFAGSADGILDGEDQDRHLKDMPFSAFGHMPKALLKKFQEKYGYLGLQFFYYGESDCDILRPGQDKSQGLAWLLEKTGLPASAVVAVGDGENDCGILKAAGLGVCVGDGGPSAMAAADRLCLPAAHNGVAALCRELWPGAFPAVEQPAHA